MTRQRFPHVIGGHNGTAWAAVLTKNLPKENSSPHTTVQREPGSGYTLILSKSVKKVDLNVAALRERPVLQAVSLGGCTSSVYWTDRLPNRTITWLSVKDE